MYVAERNMGMMRPSSTVLPLSYARSMGQFLPSRSDRNYLASFVYFLCHTTEKSIARISLVIISRMKVNQIILIFIVTSNIELKTEVCSFEVFEQSLVFFFLQPHITISHALLHTVVFAVVAVKKNKSTRYYEKKRKEKKRKEKKESKKKKKKFRKKNR